MAEEGFIIEDIAINVADISCDGDESMKSVRKRPVSQEALPSEEENHTEELNAA